VWRSLCLPRSSRRHTPPFSERSRPSPILRHPTWCAFQKYFARVASLASPPHSRASTTRCLSVCEPDPLYRLAQSWRAFSPSCAGPRQANNRPLVAFVCSIKVRLEGNSDVAVGTAPIASGSAQPQGVHRFSARQLLGKPEGGGHCLLADFRLAASQQKPPPRFAAGRWVRPTGLPSSSGYAPQPAGLNRQGRYAAALWLAELSAIFVSSSSACFSSWRFSSRRSAASCLPSCFAQAISVP
jgi:hypothetical protein